MDALSAMFVLPVLTGVNFGGQVSTALGAGQRNMQGKRNSIAGRAGRVDTALMTELRTAVPEDAIPAARVHIRSWQAAYPGLIAQEYLDGLEPKTWSTRYAFGRVGIGVPFTVLAVDGDTICGLATTGLCRDDDLPGFGELLAIYVDPGCVRSGVGSRLIAAGRERLSAIGVAQASLWVLDGNVAARRFYERDGWAFDGTRRTREYGGAPADEVRYRREL
jgi:ribosomal protein S18 acetylase RimI-like enzyme